MTRILVLVLSALSSATVVAAQPEPARAAAVAPQKVGFSPERLARIGEAMNGEVAKGTLPGAVVLVARRGQIAYFEAFGFQDKDAGKKMTRDSIFRVYSMTKPFATVAAMMLMEEGKLELTDPVSKFLPSLKGLKVAAMKKDPATGEVTYTLANAEREPTIQDLLRHTSGFVYDFVTPNAQVKSAYVKEGLLALDPSFFTISSSEFVEKIGRAPLAFQPGTAWEYSFSADVLSRVIEKITNMRLSAFLEQRLFKPLRMNDTAFWLPKEKLARVAQPFAKDPISGDPSAVYDPSQEPKNDSGGAGSLSTTMDYYRFSQMMLNRGQLDGKRFLSPTTVALMTSDHLGTIQPTFLSPGGLLMGVPGYTFGLGFMVRQGPGIAGVPGSQGEFMWGGAQGTFFWIDPKEQLVGVFMSQAGGPIRQYYRKLIKQLVYQAIVDEAPSAQAVGMERGAAGARSAVAARH
jgi:CubicO group peptidase (beta-lactamase class C family)